MNAHATRLESQVAHQVAVQRRIGANSLNDQFVQCQLHALERYFAAFPVADYFSDEGIVERWHDVFVVQVGVDPNARTTRGMKEHNFTR